MECMLKWPVRIHWKEEMNMLYWIFIERFFFLAFCAAKSLPVNVKWQPTQLVTIWRFESRNIIPVWLGPKRKPFIMFNQSFSFYSGYKNEALNLHESESWFPSEKMAGHFIKISILNLVPYWPKSDHCMNIWPFI